MPKGRVLGRGGVLCRLAVGGDSVAPAARTGLVRA